MKRTLLALILALALLASLCTGCAKTEPSAAAPAEEAAQTPAPAEPAEEPAEAAPEAPAEEAPAAEPAPAEAAPEEPTPEEPAVTVTYPVGDGSQTLDFWKPYENFFTAFADEYSQFESVQAMEEATGINLNFISCSVSAATEQFQLMVASGDWPDFSGSTYYTGDAITAYNDDVILDLTDLIPQYAPDMWARATALSDGDYAGLFTDGMILASIMIEHDNYQDEGNVTRGDWLREMGMEIPQNFDEFIDLMYAIHTNYNTDYTYKMGTDGIMIGMQDIFDTEFVTLSSDNGSLTMFLQDDQILNAGTTDGYREYLELLAQLYADRIINAEFFTQSIDRNTGLSLTATGHVGVWADRANNAVEYAAYVDEANADFEVAYLPIFSGEDGRNNYMDNPNRASTSAEGSMMVYTTCEYPDLVLNLLNYPFTEAGMLLANYGIEGLSYELDEAGEPHFTDAVLNPSVGSTNEASRYYAWSLTGSYDNKAKLLSTYSDETLTAIELWNDWDTMDWSTVIPDAAGLDSEEQDSVTSAVTDLNTLQVEWILRFITGDLELNDENWNAYLDIMETNDLSRVVSVYQGAYDDYLVEVAAMNR